MVPRLLVGDKGNSHEFSGLSKLGGGLKSANLEELEYPSLEEIAAVED